MINGGGCTGEAEQLAVVWEEVVGLINSVQKKMQRKSTLKDMREKAFFRAKAKFDFVQENER